MTRALRRLCVLSTTILLSLLLALPATAGPEVEQPVKKVKKVPTRADWMAAGLEKAEYAEATQLGVSIEQWKELAKARSVRSTAGWACVGVGVLGGGILATVWMAQGWDLKTHPEKEVFIMSLVGATATVLTGIIVAATPPGPEDFMAKWKMEDEGIDGGGIALGDTTLYPGATGLTLTF